MIRILDTSSDQTPCRVQTEDLSSSASSLAKTDGIHLRYEESSWTTYGKDFDRLTFDTDTANHNLCFWGLLPA